MKTYVQWLYCLSENQSTHFMFKLWFITGRTPPNFLRKSFLYTAISAARPLASARPTSEDRLRAEPVCYSGQINVTWKKTPHREVFWEQLTFSFISRTECGFFFTDLYHHTVCFIHKCNNTYQLFNKKFSWCIPRISSCVGPLYTLTRNADTSFPRQSLQQYPVSTNFT
jgi:hypothetical protein